jgi:hypothetical protein
MSISMSVPRIVVDTSVIVAGLRSQLGASNRVLTLVAERHAPEDEEMSKNTYPLKLPTSVKKAAAELAASDGVSLNQFIAAAVAEKVGSLRAADDFLRERAGTAKPKDMLKYLRRAPKVAPNADDMP